MSVLAQGEENQGVGTWQLKDMGILLEVIEMF